MDGSLLLSLVKIRKLSQQAKLADQTCNAKVLEECLVEITNTVDSLLQNKSDTVLFADVRSN